MERGIPKMIGEERPNRLDELIVLLVAGRVSMQLVVGQGYTLGQVMRALVDAKSQGLISVLDGKSVLSELGLAKLRKLRTGTMVPKEKWIAPMLEEQIPSIDLNEVWLPDEYEDLS